MDDVEILAQIDDLRKKLKIASIKTQRKSKSYGRYLKSNFYICDNHIRDRKREEWFDAFDKEMDILLSIHKLKGKL